MNGAVQVWVVLGPVLGSLVTLLVKYLVKRRQANSQRARKEAAKENTELRADLTKGLDTPEQIIRLAAPRKNGGLNRFRKWAGDNSKQLGVNIIGGILTTIIVGAFIRFMLDNNEPSLPLTIFGLLIGGTITSYAFVGIQTTKNKAKVRSLIFIVGLLLTILSSALGGLYWGTTKRPFRAHPVFSDLNQCFPRNNYGVDWGVFNDNPFNGNSIINIKVHPNVDNAADCYAVAPFSLGEESTIRPYCGVFSGFSAKLAEASDVSSYSGVQFEAWHEGDFPEGVRVYLQIASKQLLNQPNGYHQFDFTEDVKRNKTRSKISAPFTDFEQAPEQKEPKVPFDKMLQQQVYQISIVIQGEKGRVAKGTIAFDNLKFFQ